MSTVPKSLSPKLLEFCRSIAPARPIYIKSKPSADAKTSACFDNVHRKIERAGGQLAYGWAIWHVPGLHFEAEHHGVWKNRQGALLDVSPQLHRVPKILFLPDPEATYDPKNARSNIYKAANDSPTATEFVTLATRRQTIIQSYRTDEHIIAMLSDADQREVSHIDGRLRQLLVAAGVQL